MNCLRPLKQWNRGFESHSRRGCLCVYSVFVLSCVQVAALRLADPPSKESYRLCIGSRNWKRNQGPTKGCRTIDRFGNPALCSGLSNLDSGFAHRLPWQKHPIFFSDITGKLRKTVLQRLKTVFRLVICKRNIIPLRKHTDYPLQIPAF
jgi:hypothetical protein